MVKIIILCALICNVNAIKLPDFIQKCNVTNRIELRSCVLKQSPKIILEYADKGYKSYVPVLDPFHIKKVTLNGTSGLNISLEDMNISGLRNSILKSFDVDLETQIMSLQLLVPQITLVGTYDISGKFILLNIEGHGPMNMIVTNATIDHLINFAFTKKSDDNEYYTMFSNELNYKIEKIQLHLDNLFNGNKVLGDQMITFLNENWQEFEKDIRPALRRTISRIITSIFEKFSGHIKKEDSFLF